MIEGTTNIKWRFPLYIGDLEMYKYTKGNQKENINKKYDNADLYRLDFIKRIILYKK